MTRERLGGIAVVVLAFWLIFIGFTGLLSLAIPAWVGAVLAIVAGILLLVGR